MKLEALVPYSSYLLHHQSYPFAVALGLYVAPEARGWELIQPAYFCHLHDGLATSMRRPD